MSTDPTALDHIEFDPQQRRMKGVAMHGNTPFDCTFVSRVADNLWQGGCTNGLILPTAIQHLVSLYPWEAYTQGHRLKSYLTVMLYDDAMEDEELIIGIAKYVNAARKSGETLVHCQAGLNRSGLVVATALILEGATPAEAIAQIREKRSPAALCNPHFLKWLEEHDWEYERG